MTNGVAHVRFKIPGGPVIAEEGLPYPVVVLAVVPESEGFAVVTAAAPPAELWSVRQLEGEPEAFAGGFELEPGVDPAKATEEFLEEWWYMRHEHREPPMPIVVAASCNGVEYDSKWSSEGMSDLQVESTTHFEPALPSDADEVLLTIAVEEPPMSARLGA